MGFRLGLLVVVFWRDVSTTAQLCLGIVLTDLYCTPPPSSASPVPATSPALAPLPSPSPAPPWAPPRSPRSPPAHRYYTLPAQSHPRSRAHHHRSRPSRHPHSLQTPHTCRRR
ncbi:hypothetical protein BZA05DRAFT_204168 [Tricharina praecox]|uniref:uncharacterized protein n=1 Tax=Tricharina praecox TaxID=43433 RepID=UPI002220B5C0|nr:uncharacterized protein BZA05DRAFT_204168 [Tricharina praecox]KAI5856558.1 hypothetical protein BZA05DRAFT_204168 [Tricharina praecox]